MRRLVREMNWAQTPLGPREAWPQSLRIAVDICLNSRFPMFLWWGPQFINLYNDAYIPILGQRHPQALGRSAPQIWAEVWPVIGPQVESVVQGGPATWHHRVPLVLERNGFTEKAYFTYSHSPVHDEAGKVGGVLCVVTEDTDSVLAERERDRLAEQRRAILESVTDAFFAVGHDWRFTYVNRQAEAVLGRSRADLLGQVVWEAYPGLVGSEFERAYRHTAVDRVATSVTSYYPDHDRWYEVHVYPADGGSPDGSSDGCSDGQPGGRPGGISIYLRDVTARMRREEQLRRNHDTFYNLIQNDPFGVFVVDADFRLRQVSLGARKTFANVYPLLDRDFGDVLRTVWPEPFASEAIARFRHTLETGDPFASPSTIEHRLDIDRVEAYDWRIERLTLPDGRFGVVCHYYDLTERQRWETELAETRRKLASALIAGEVGTFEWDIRRDRLWGDHNFARMFGIKRDATGGAPLSDYMAAIHPADRDRVAASVQKSVETGCDYEIEYRILTRELPRWVIARGKVEFDASGQPARFPGVVLDVSERKRAELVLFAQNRAMELVATGAPMSEALGSLTSAVDDHFGGAAVAAILLVDKDGCTLRTGAATGLPCEYSAAIDGIKARAGLGTCADAAARNVVVVTPDIAAADSWQGLSHLPLALGLKAAWSMPIRASDGRVLGTFGTYFRECRDPSETERRIVENMCRVAALAIERRHDELELRQSERRFRELADAMPQIVWVTRPDGYHEYYNRRWYEFTGVREGSTDGEGWNRLFHPDDQARAWERWRHSLATGEPYEVEYRLRHRGGEYRWTLGRALPIRNERGNIERWFGTCTDIDAMKRLTAEREQLLERERSARNEAEAANRAKDRFLAVLSHELRTPLSPVVMTIPAMELDPELPFKFREDLAMVRRNIDLEVKLIDDLLDLSRVTSGKLRLQIQPVRVHELLLHVVRSSLSETSGKRLDVRHELHARNDRINADPARLQQVFWNLLRNAVKFTPDGGTVTVRTSTSDAGKLIVQVADTGVGIPADVLPRVFDAFEQGDARVTRQFGGLGLGLAIAKAVVEMHGGAISADSGGHGRGSTFTVELGVAAGNDLDHAPAPGTGDHGQRSSRAQRVLLVEDHPDTARTLARLLGASGFEVKTASSAASALQLAADHSFDLMVSDIGLPDATGYELMEQMRDRHGLRGIALSGYGMEDDMRKSLEAGFVDHVIKPVNLGQLEAVIGRVLRSS